MNESQYINPIIEAMGRTAALRQSHEQLQEQARRNKAEEVLQQQQIDAHNKQIEYEHQQAQDLLEKYHMPMLQAQLNKSRLDAMDYVRTSLAQGVDPSAFRNPDVNIPNIPLPTGGQTPSIKVPGTPEGMISLPGGGGNVSISAFPNPQQAALIAGGREKTIAQMRAEGTLPIQLDLLDQEFKNKKDLQDQAEKFQSGIVDKQLTAADARDKFDRATQLQIAGMANNSREKIANLEHGVTPEQLSSGVTQALLGMRQFKSDNIYDRNIMQAVTGQGARVLEPKEVDTLKQLNGLGDVFDKMGGFINKYLPSEQQQGTLPAELGAIRQGIKAKSGLPTDIKNDFDIIKSNAVTIGRGLESMTGGRMLSKQLDLDMNSLVGPGMTKEQALRKLDSLKQQYINSEQNVILTGMPDFQKNAIIKQYGIKQPSLSGQQTLSGQPIQSSPIQWVRDPNGNPIPAPPPPPPNVPRGPQ